eukprot:TRINITY_DN10861_c0_g1_i1.p2 TRINITY_DN10861_c0_g1~~TRINITY_DN10861_c0_g1_i1.p2  ORF type:complete len:171 (-),score=60.65 TRINITY_DN10861_c0_g1_i1:408-896(-)
MMRPDSPTSPAFDRSFDSPVAAPLFDDPGAEDGADGAYSEDGNPPVPEPQYIRVDHMRVLEPDPAAPLDPAVAAKVLRGQKLSAEERLAALYHPELCAEGPADRRAKKGVTVYNSSSVADALTMSDDHTPVVVAPRRPPRPEQPEEKPFVSSKKIFAAATSP